MASQTVDRAAEAAVQVSDTHLTSEQVAAYLDQRLAPADRSRAEAHLSSCGECRRELADVVRLQASAPTVGQHRQVRRLATLAAAAAVILAVALVLPRSDAPSSTSEFRNAGAESNVVHTLQPPSGSTIDPTATTFVWRRDDDASYQMRVVDSAGAVVFNVTTSDTTLVLPANVRLAPSARYFWYVDALRADGFSVSSGPQPFSTAR